MTHHASFLANRGPEYSYKVAYEIITLHYRNRDSQFRTKPTVVNDQYLANRNRRLDNFHGPVQKSDNSSDKVNI